MRDAPAEEPVRETRVRGKVLLPASVTPKMTRLSGADSAAG